MLDFRLDLGRFAIRCHCDGPDRDFHHKMAIFIRIKALNTHGVAIRQDPAQADRAVSAQTQILQR